MGNLSYIKLTRINLTRYEAPCGLHNIVIALDVFILGLPYTHHAFDIFHAMSSLRLYMHTALHAVNTLTPSIQRAIINNIPTSTGVYVNMSSEGTCRIENNLYSLFFPRLSPR